MASPLRSQWVQKRDLAWCIRMTPAFETLRFEKHDRVVILTLARPERLNAINAAMSRELPVAWEAVSGDPEVSAVVLTGAGARALCSGFDVGEIARGEAWIGELRSRGPAEAPRLTALQNHCWKPVVTAVNGLVNAAGLQFVAESDLVIAAEHATFSDSRVRVGQISGYEAVRLARRMPLEGVMRLALLGGAEPVCAGRALRLGLVGEVLTAERLLPRALELARMMGSHSPAASTATKRIVWQSLNYGLDDAIAHARTLMGEHRGHPDVEEGARAYVEKRAPQWTLPE